jgi:hypothetical protein
MDRDENGKPKLPHPGLLREAQDWLRAGCPAVWRHFGEKGNTERAWRTLLDLVDALPGHFEQYAYGTAENRAAWAEKIPGEET